MPATRPPSSSRPVENSNSRTEIFGKGLGLGVQGAENFASGRIAVSVQNAVAAVCALAGEGKLGSIAIEFGAPLNQFFDALGAFFHQNFGGIGITQAVAGI